MMWAASLVWWGLGTALAAEEVESEPISLPQAIEEALQTNLELRQRAIDVGLAETGLTRARSRWDPTLGLSASTSTSNQPNNNLFVGEEVLSISSGRWSASLSQSLPTGGQLSAAWFESRTTSTDETLINPTTVSNGANLSLAQPLLRGGGPAALWDLRRTRLGLTRAQIGWRASVEQAILDVSAAYWRLVAADQRQALAVQSRAIAAESVSDMEDRYDAGFVGSGDVLQMRRAFGAARLSEVGAEAARQQANNALCRLLGRDVRTPPHLTPSDAPLVPESLPDEAAILTSAMANNAGYLQATLDRSTAELAVKGLRNQALPDLALNGDVGLSGLGNTAAEARRTTTSGEFNAWSVGASVSVPLLGRAARANVRQARMDAETARLAFEAAEQDLVLRVQDAVRAVQRDRLQVELATETERVAALALEADRELLTEGRGSSRNVAQSLELLQQAGVALLESQIGLQRSLLELKRVAGTLIAPADLPEPDQVRSAALQ
ncbi:MAG: TolC family protein [Myxococcota bacterium]